MKQPGKRRSGLRGALVRFLVMVAVLATAFFLFRDSQLSQVLEIDRLIALVDRVRALWWSPLALIVLWILMSPLGLPASPLVAAGGVLFGVGWGTLYNCVGAMLGASATFFFARLLGHDFVAHLLGEERVAKVEHRLESYGFRALVGIRFLPLPWPLVNFGAALAGFRFGPFITATFIGVVPVIFVYTFFFASLVGATTEEGRAKLLQLVAAIAVLALLGLLRVFARRRSMSSMRPKLPPRKAIGRPDCRATRGQRSGALGCQCRLDLVQVDHDGTVGATRHRLELVGPDHLAKDFFQSPGAEARLAGGLGSDAPRRVG